MFYKVTNHRFDKVNNITLLNYSKTVLTQNTSQYISLTYEIFIRDGNKFF